MKVTSYKVNILYHQESKRYYGELWVNGIQEIKTAYFMNETLAITRLNKRIEAFNLLNSAKIPLYKKGKENMKKAANMTKPEPTEIAQESEQSLPDKIVEQKEITAPTEAKKAPKPHRKPFTPYGLTGYLVDKAGNIRLHLDRRASARTIVLEPAMFAMLADMVKATQEQAK